ncbi:mechanosensitive ion channel family protein [Rhodovulum sp. DZ06]|uniref:mechanosensitive ion channel family protein n=1 Tax=Rhodovulum sp. DZ06 TaxID=3425126 RepID=UPI003D33FBE0
MTHVPTPPARRVLIAALLALAALLGALAPAAAQPVDYGALLRELGVTGGDAAQEEPAPEMSRIGGPAPAFAAEDDPNRAPEVAAYGRIAAAQAEEANVIQRTTESVSALRQRVQMTLRAAPDLFEELERYMARNAPDGRSSHFLGVFVLTVICVMIGRAVVSLYAAFIALPLMQAAQRGPRPRTLGDKLPVLTLRFALTSGAVAICVSVAAGLGLAVVDDHRPTLDMAALTVGTWGLWLLVDTIWRMTICPYLPEYRIPKLTDEAARRLYLWVSVSAGVSIVGQGFTAWVDALGTPAAVHALVASGTGLLSLIFALVMIWANRPAISSAILGGRARRDATWFASVCSVLWAPVVTVYLIVSWVEGVVRMLLGYEQNIPLLTGAFVTLMCGLIVYAVSVFAVERLFARARMRRAPPPPAQDAPVEAHVMEGDGPDGDGDGDDEGGPMRGGRAVEELRPQLFPHMAVRRQPMRSFEDLAQRAAAIFAIGVAAWLLARIWGGDAIFRDGQPLDFLQDVIDKLFIGYIAFHAVRIWLDKRIEEEGGDDVASEPGDEGGGAGSRLGTLLPLFRAFILFVIVAVTALTIAMEMGVNVAPLFAGAGVVGLAIGFGAQALVRDILSGVFFLLDDAFRKGEYIDVGEVKGTVEKISIRSFQLRHHLGALHTIPFGEITHLTNFSRDWVMMKLPLRLTYDTDVEKVRKLVKKLGQQLLEHPTEGPKFVQPLKSQGVIQMEDSAMIVRIKYMTRPGDQWTTRKLVYHEIRELFAREGIKFAHREVTVRIPDLPKDRAPTAQELEAVEEAAGAAARTVAEDGPPGASTVEMR